MFTGIIREIGTVREAARSGGGLRLTVEAPRSRPGLEPGGSIAVDGVCLTVTALGADSFTADVVPESVARTTLGDTRPGRRVNLEPALRLDRPLDGHLVQGHVDGVGTVASVAPRGSQRTVTVTTPPELLPFVAGKGSIAVHGVSLTVTAVGPDSFAVALIPTTRTETTLGELVPGTRVNLEVDVLARYAARWLAAGGAAAAPDAAGGTGLTVERLEELGY